jgi:hypothetical protein
VNEFGSEKSALRAIRGAVTRLAERQGLRGVNTRTVKVGEQTIRVRFIRGPSGKVEIGTAWKAN